MINGDWRFTKDRPPDYGRNVLCQTSDGWMIEAFRNTTGGNDFYRAGRFTLDPSQIVAWTEKPMDCYGN